MWLSKSDSHILALKSNHKNYKQNRKKKTIGLLSPPSIIVWIVIVEVRIHVSVVINAPNPSMLCLNRTKGWFRLGVKSEKWDGVQEVHSSHW